MTAPATITHSYFVVMIDHGRKGREAIVDPEITRREVVSRIQSKDYGTINFIHFVSDGSCEDVTNEILKEAGFYEADDAPLTGENAIDWRRDHARGLREAV